MMRRAIFVTAAAMALSGCISLLPKPPEPPRVYGLTAAPAPSGPQGLVAAPVVVSVALPGGAQALMGREVVWVTDGVLAYVGAAEWSGRAPELLQALLAETLDGMGLVRAGVRSGAGIRADYEITWDLTAFQIEQNDRALQARLSAVARLVDARSRVLIAQVRVDETQPVRDRSQSAATAALETAARAAADRIARALGTAAGQAQPVSPPPS